MIEPTSRDINRKVEARHGGRRVTGRIASFDADWVYVRVSGLSGSPAPLSFRRADLAWPALETPGRREPSAHEKTARDMLERAGIRIEVVSENEWRVGDGFIFWPSQGAWRAPNGAPGYGGARPLIAAIRNAAAP